MVLISQKRDCVLPDCEKYYFVVEEDTSIGCFIGAQPIYGEPLDCIILGKYDNLELAKEELANIFQALHDYTRACHTSLSKMTTFASYRMN